MQKTLLLYTVILSMVRVDPAFSTNLAFRVTLSVNHVLDNCWHKKVISQAPEKPKARRGKEETMVSTLLLCFFKKS